MSETPSQPTTPLHLHPPSPLHLAAATESLRYACDSVLYERREGMNGLWVATDAKMLALVADKQPCATSDKTMIPREAIQRSYRRKREGASPAIEVDKTAGLASVGFGFDGGKVGYALRAGEFPPFPNILPDPAASAGEYVRIGLDARALLHLARALGAGDEGPCHVVLLVKVNDHADGKGVTKPMCVMPGVSANPDAIDPIGLLMPANITMEDPIKQFSERRARHLAKQQTEGGAS